MRQALALALTLAAGTAGCGGALARSTAPNAAPTRLFAADSIWGTPLRSDAALDPRSAQLVAHLTATVAAEQAARTGPWINTVAYSVPIYTVGAGTPTVRVRLRYGRHEPALAAAWRAVPLPEDAQPAAGHDADLVVWQPSSGRLWEFWRLGHESSGWAASWGGAMRHAGRQNGVYGPRVWPRAHRSWGISASSLSLAGGTVTLGQLARGTIGHALAIAVPDVQAGVFSAPAERTDGTSGSTQALPEGAHLRLDPHLDLALLRLPRLTLMLARAAQRYGIYVTDRSPDIALYAQDPTPTATEPFTGASGYFGGPDPRAVMEAFPWSHLQLLRMRLRHGS